MQAAAPDYVLKVFVDRTGEHGNDLAVYASRDVSPDIRQSLAAASGCSETVFVEHLERGVIDIYSPTSQLKFAGHPVVGIAWLLRQLDVNTPHIQVRAGTVPIRQEGEWNWAEVKAEWTDPSVLRRYATPETISHLSGSPPGMGVCYAWAFLDEDRGEVTARMFGPAVGIPEDEATGGAAVALAAQTQLNSIFIKQGAGSEIAVRRLTPSHFELGGRVTIK